MTRQEEELYEKIKEDKDNVLFNMLFTIANGQVMPIEGKSLKPMADSIPMIVDNSTMNLFSTGFSIGNSIENIRTQKSFDEISNEIAENSPFGKKSLFHKQPKEEFSLAKKFGFRETLAK